MEKQQTQQQLEAEKNANNIAIQETIKYANFHANYAELNGRSSEAAIMRQNINRCLQYIEAVSREYNSLLAKFEDSQSKKEQTEPTKL